jgi:hypothetical protein
MTTEEPTAAPTTEPASTTPTARSSSPLAIGLIVVVIGALMLIGSAFLDWLENDAGETLKGTDIQAEFLIDNESTTEDPSLVVPLAVVAAIVGVGAVLRRKVIALVGGVLGLVVVGLFYYQLEDLQGVDALDVLAFGFWIAVAGVVVAIVGSLLPQQES